MSDESFEKNVQGEQEEQVNSENRGEQENLIEQQSIEAQEVKKDLNDQKDQPDQKIQEGQEAQYMQSQTNSYSQPHLQDGQSSGYEPHLQNGQANGKKPNTLLDILLGLGLSAAAYFIIWLTTTVRMPVVFILLVDFVVLVALGFLSVRFLRRGHKPAGATMLILISPAILGLLIFGACAALFTPFY